MNSNTQKYHLGSRLISSAISWGAVLENELSIYSSMPERAKYTGIALCGIELTVIELSLKAILAMEGYDEVQITNFGHKLSQLYSKIPNIIRKDIEDNSGFDNRRILSELKRIDVGDNGLVNWRYLEFIDDIKTPHTRQHFCDTFIKSFSSACHEVAKSICKVDMSKTTLIENRPRTK